MYYIGTAIPTSLFIYEPLGALGLGPDGKSPRNALELRAYPNPRS